MIPDEQLTFGALLSRFRLAAGLTQADLAERAGLSVRGISDLERGVKIHPRAYTVRHLADALALAGPERAMFERSALDPARLSQTVQSGEQAPTLDSGGRAARAPRTAPGQRLRAIRGHWTFKYGVFGGIVVVLLATGLTVSALRPASRKEARPPARLVGSWAVSMPSPSTLVAPAAVAISHGGIVYVADSGADRIDAFSPTGRLLFSWGTPGSKPGQLLRPQGLTPDGLGHVYVADTGNDRIDEFSSHGRFLGSFGTRGSRPGEFRSPEGVTVSAATSWIYVADTGNHRVQALTPAGSPVGGWDAGASQRGTMVQPTSLVVTDGGLVMVADGQAQRVEVLGNDGSFLWDEISIPPPEFVAPSAVARDAANYQYTLDTGLNTVRKFDAYGHVLATWHGRFRSARGLAVDAQGNIYVADTGNQRILIFAPAGSLAAVWSGSTSRGMASTPRALSMDRSGNVYVADARANQIVVLSPSGRVLERIRGGGKSGPLSRPSGVAVGPGGQVYVADTGNNRIVRFSRSGTLDAIWVQRGAYPGPFRAPHGIRVDARGRVFVADTLSGRVEELEATGSYLQIWYPEITTPRRGSRTFPPSFCGGAYPCGRWTGMAVDAGGFIYVTDTLHNLVLKLSPRGETVARWGGTGSQSSRFRMPEGIAVSRAGSIYVADTGNHRVDVLAPSGKVLGSIHEGLEEPEDVLFRDGRGGAGTLYVADGATGRIEKFVSLR